MKRRLLSLLCCGLSLFLLGPGAALAQQGSISGQVIDGTTEGPLPGANVVIVGANQGAASGADGSYSIENVEPGEYVLRASFVGYTDSEVEVTVEPGEEVEQNITMNADLNQLEDVVVIGYGERQRRDVTGAVATVGSDEVENVPTSSPEELLQGRTAGVRVNKASGLAGSAIQVDIRQRGGARM